MELYDSQYVYFEWDDKLEGKKGFVAQNIASLRSQVISNPKGIVTISSSGDDVCPFTYFIDNGFISDYHYQFAYYDPYYEFRKAYIEGKQLQFKDSTGNWRDVDGTPLFTTDEYRIKPEWYIVLGDYGLSLTTEPRENETVLFEGTEGECIQWLDEHKKFENIMLAWKQGKTIETMGPDSYWHKVVTPHWHTDNSYRVVDECKGCMKYNYCCNSDGIRCKGYCTKALVPFDTVEELINAWDNKYPQNKNRPEGTMPLIWIKNKQKNRVYLITDFLFDQCYGQDVGTYESNYRLGDLFKDFTFLDGSIIGKVRV